MKNLAAIEVPIKQGTPEWNEWRAKGIGASDAPVINGTSPYRTQRQLFLEKIGQPIEENDESKEFIFAKGHRTEALIRTQFQEYLNTEIKPVCFRHGKFDYIRASLDGFDSTHGVLEAKLVGKAVLEKASAEAVIPIHHYTQMQHQFLVTGADIGNWFGHDGKKTGIVVPIRADLNFIKQLEDLEHRFWEDVQNKKSPPLSDRDYFTPEDERLLAELRDAKELSENAASHYETLRNEIVNLYKHPKISGGGVKLFKVRREGSIDFLSIPEIAAAIEATKAKLKPEYIDSFKRKSSESWSIRIDAKKGASNESRSN